MSDLNNQATGSEEYTLKRMRDGISQEDIIGFLKRIINTSFEENQIIKTSAFQNVSLTSLYISLMNRKESIDQGKNPGLFLYKSDLAFLFYDIASSFIKNLDEYKNHSEYQKLTSVLIYCKNNDRGFNITNSADEYLNSLLTDHISRVSNFIISILDKDEDGDKDDEGDDKEKKDEDSGIAIPDQKDDKTARVVPTKEEAVSESDQDGQVAQKEKQPDEPLTTKNILFSEELRNQATKFTAIALSQLEQHHGLPQGTLANSKELQEILSQKTLGFFLTTIGDGNHDRLLAPETRLQLIREYIWLVQNDFRTTAVISTHLTSVLKENSDPNLKEQIKTALSDAESGKGKGITKLISDIAENPELGTILSVLKNDKLTSDKEDYLASETSSLLGKELQRIGVHSDKLSLSQKNVANVIDTWIAQGLPIQLLKYVDEGRFRLIFGDEIPYNPQFVDSLEDIWIARRSILGRKTGQILLHNEARFATQEALALLDKKSGELNDKQSDGVFRDGVAAPTRQILVGSKEAPIKDGEELVELIHSRKPISNSKKRDIFLKQVWNSKDIVLKQEILVVLGYGEAGSKAVQNISEDVSFYPREMGLHDMAPLALGNAAFYDQSQQDSFNSPYIPSSGVMQDPLANVGGFGKRAKGLGKKLKRGVKGLRSRLGKKAAKKAAEKAANAALSKAATAASGAVNPALGVIAKLAQSKKGRKVLLAVGGLGLASLVIPLTTIGGWIGSTIGGIAGGIFGGPAGAAAGAIGGGWTGYGIQNWINGVFGGGKGSTLPLSGSGPALSSGGGATSLGVNQATQGAQATTIQSTAVVGQTLTTIGSQAVIGTIAAVAGGGILMHAISSGAMLADFPVVKPLNTQSGLIPGKESEFITIEKRAFIAGCPENKCENPSFPLRVEYTLTITPKGNYTVQILDATDTLKVNHSDIAWEEEGKTPPDIPERVKGLTDFEELYEEMIINPGESVTISYFETLDQNYNHSSVLNTFDLKIFANDPQTGTEQVDNAITGEVVYIGDYSQGAGCWAASGGITQLPGGGYSHNNADAFDIANSEGTPIFAPFSGQACPGNMDSCYGNHVVLSTDVGNFVLAHMRSLAISGCTDVVAGEVLGAMGTTGCSSGPHLHIGLIGSSPSSGGLSSLMPDGASIKVGDPVRSCYE